MNRFFILILGVMQWGRSVLSFLFCLIFSLVLLQSDSSSKGTFIQVMTSTLLYPVQSTIMWVDELKSLDNENSRLLEENAELRLKIDSYRQSAKENLRLREYLKFPKHEDFPVLVAQVVSRSPGRINSSCMINRGEIDGIEVNMPVFTPQGLVGKISKVMYNHAFVQFLNDPASKVSSIENSTRNIGILESRNGISLEIEFPVHSEVSLGDTLVSSGFGGIFPKGIQIGKLHSWEKSDLEVLKRAIVIPFQNPAYLEEMFILKSKTSWTVEIDK
mgnify:CR=1 FL=1